MLLGDKDIDGNLELPWIFMKIIEENLNKTEAGELKSSRDSNKHCGFIITENSFNS